MPDRIWGAKKAPRLLIALGENMRNQIFEAGQICNVHGLRGEVKILAWTDYPEKFEEFDHVLLKEKNEYIKIGIRSIKYQKSNIIAKLSGIDSVDDAEKLKGKTVYVERDQLGELDEGFYISDLIGIDVITDEGENLGKISDVLQTGANDVYVVKNENGSEILLPVIDECVLSVDIDECVCRVHLLEGLR